MDYNTYKITKRRRKGGNNFLLPLVIIISICSILFFIIIQTSNIILPDSNILRLSELWNEQRYTEVFDLSEALLQEDPLNQNYLYYNGISGFYSSLSFSDHDTRQLQLNRALFSLRKLSYSPITGLEDRVRYILGKIYFHKGIYYYDLSEKYLGSVLGQSFDANDLYEYLGSIYLATDREVEGIDFLLQAIEFNPQDILYLTVARAYEQVMDYQNSLEFYKMSNTLAQDNLLRQEALLGEGRVLFELDNNRNAEEIFQTVISNNNQISEAYFYLGEIYARENDLVRARANWREAYNLDRTNLLALERLNS